MAKKYGDCPEKLGSEKANPLERRVEEPGKATVPFVVQSSSCSSVQKSSK